MSTREILEAARALIDTPEKWGQEDELRDESRRCAMLAVSDVALVGDENFSKPLRLLHEVCGTGVISYNDTHTHAEVLAMFDLAIAKAWRDETAVVEEWREVCGLPELAAA